MRIFFLLVVSALLLGSCSPYQKMLRSEDIGLKFQYADSLYNAGKYKKALKLMEQLVPAYRGKPQAEKLMFLYADTFYILGDYYTAGYQFERFTTSYPKSEKIEEAAFKGAKSYYELSPRYSLDQKDTFIGLEKLQGFINMYPNSVLRQEANILVAELTNKIERKRFEIAKQYFNTSDYKAAIKAFDLYVVDFPGSEYRMEAFYLRLESAYLLAIGSLPNLVEGRLKDAKSHYASFNRYYSNSKRKADADKILQEIEERLQNKQV
ncbi:MAG: outer membrane protein assembly factor BamD [Flavobacteriaceae bacterium CG_4_8_14_3_um_filter_34_10]|nr:MAG: outer membrane protein assembly factor BamD [Flavobacteriaceae bacterium CG2_30_34_30]PIX08168.1 MAG: outer membrane protein assembly factor BamD [Flavobacteriaceae bacterium CG_4_8_14_3_um_filter_34_10]PJC06576.1 MAG: outer membrane protein assembly factor BamD [Flavobacteriaceae bacterium CG_4_9_14_0_8_um_filter_34_30]